METACRIILTSVRTHPPAQRSTAPVASPPAASAGRGTEIPGYRRGPPRRSRSHIQNLEFEFAKSSIRRRSFPSLDKVADLLVKKNFSLKTRRPHRQRVGSPDRNMRLSKDRAESVKAYLVSRGANPSRDSRPPGMARTSPSPPTRPPPAARRTAASSLHSIRSKAPLRLSRPRPSGAAFLCAPASAMPPRPRRRPLALRALAQASSRRRTPSRGHKKKSHHLVGSLFSNFSGRHVMPFQQGRFIERLIISKAKISQKSTPSC